MATSLPTRDTAGACILALDGGGVKGLSSLYILHGIMIDVNPERKRAGKSTVKPCEIFDLICGTSTGGLIAIMLGRLEMDKDQCIKAYNEMCEKIFKDAGRRVKLTTHKFRHWKYHAR